jgi:uroporphyrinogen decarboxylase
MTGLERVVESLQHKEADRVPTCALFCGACHRVYGCGFDEFSQDGEIAGKAFVQSTEVIGHDGNVLLMDLTVEAHDFGQETQFLRNDTTRPNYNNPLVTGPDDYGKVQPIKACDTKGLSGISRMKEMVKTLDIVMNETGNEKAVVAFVYGPLGTLSMMRGAENLFYDCVKYPEAILEAEEIITEALIDYTKELCKLKPHGVCLDTLFASSCIMSKKLWTKMEAPFAKRISEVAKECGTTFWVHNCGNGVYFDAQCEAMDPIGISYAYVPSDCESFEDMKAKYGDKLVLFGHVNPAERLFLGSKEELLEECKHEMQMLGNDGGYIMAPGCEFPPNGPILRAMEMVEAAELYGRYPLK